MKLREVNFNKIGFRGLSIFDGEKEVACGSIDEVLKQVPHFADREVESTNSYFDIYVIRLKPLED